MKILCHFSLFLNQRSSLSEKDSDVGIELSVDPQHITKDTKSGAPDLTKSIATKRRVNKNYLSTFYFKMIEKYFFRCRSERPLDRLKFLPTQQLRKQPKQFPKELYEFSVICKVHVLKCFFFVL